MKTNNVSLLQATVLVFTTAVLVSVLSFLLEVNVMRPHNYQKAQHPHNPSLSMSNGNSTASPQIRILSHDPFIAHLANFISPEERRHLKQLGGPLLDRSTVLLEDGTRIAHPARTSSTAYLPADDPVVRAIARRAAELQGHVPVADVDVQITSYEPEQQYKPHVDWFPEPGRETNRLSTIFAIIEADCSNCGTSFPNIIVDWKSMDRKWCDTFDCDQEILTSRNIPGSAVFWRNLDSTGEGTRDVLHAGLPAVNGTKMGLNIWTQIDLDRFQQVPLGGERKALRP